MDTPNNMIFLLFHCRKKFQHHKIVQSDYFDVNIGYQFVNVLYRDQYDRSVGVDIDLINDVCEQNGGGGEPLL
jgi:hypothetical protein